MDIDIDFKNRDEAVALFKPIIASRLQDGKLTRHNVGVYFQDIPIHPIEGVANIEYNTAEQLGYTKVDFLNLSVYADVRDNDHLDQMVAQEPMWELLEDREIVGQLFQLHTEINTELCVLMKPTSVEQLAIVLAIARPGKVHLIGRSWDEIAKEIWLPSDRYYFKKSHAYSYAMVVVVQLNMMVEKAMAETQTSYVC